MKWHSDREWQKNFSKYFRIVVTSDTWIFTPDYIKLIKKRQKKNLKCNTRSTDLSVWVEECQTEWATNAREGSYPDFNVSPLTKPLLTRFGWSEFRHLLPVQLQNTRAVVSHHLGANRDVQMNPPHFFCTQVINNECRLKWYMNIFILIPKHWLTLSPYGSAKANITLSFHKILME